MTSDNPTKKKRVWRTPREVAQAEKSAEAFAKWLMQAYQWKPKYFKTKAEDVAWMHGLFFGLAAKVSAGRDSSRD